MLSMMRAGRKTQKKAFAQRSLANRNKRVMQEKKANLANFVNQFQNIVLQQYLDNPCLYNGRKFDLRCYMVIICCKPFYVFSQEGYARISLNDYTAMDFGVESEGKDG